VKAKSLSLLWGGEVSLVLSYIPYDVSYQSGHYRTGLEIQDMLHPDWP
jgi:hypothetical protein